MFGVIVNTVSIAAGGIIGFIFKKGIPDKISSAVMNVMGLSTLAIGIQGAIKTNNVIALILSMAIGTAIGTLIDIEKYITIFGEFLKKNFAKNADKNNNIKFVDAFVSASVLFGVGAMAILGSIDAGLKNDFHIFYIKSTIDFVSSIMLAASMGIGVAFAGLTILISQGTMTLLASKLTFIAANAILLNEIGAVGNLMIMAIGLNLLSVTKLKIANMLPAIFLVPIFCMFIK